VTARANTHFFSSTLVESQFTALENPVGEPGVLRLDALLPLAQLQSQVTAWLHAKETV
jgi:gluconokinase